ncbi:Ribosomal protein S25 family protein [Prunus dulcis]|uniref:40S ribosomal protein S25 n=1 Tax=Prunus dulcis TaxID=3755 RepID=A0A4Y1RTC0_PRUDU|nr:Ribosomal protein S25 family protein [Prunus dulcis]
MFAPKKDKAPPPSSKPAKSGGGKQKKKKWSKGKQKEKVNNMVLFDQGTYDKLIAEAPKYKLITPSILSDRLRINGSLARKAIRDLMARGAIRMTVVEERRVVLKIQVGLIRNWIGKERNTSVRASLRPFSLLLRLPSLQVLYFFVRTLQALFYQSFWSKV